MGNALVGLVKWVVGVAACAAVATGCFADAPEDAAPNEGQVDVSEALTFNGYCPNMSTHASRVQPMRVTDQVYAFLSGGASLPADRFGTPAYNSGYCGGAIGDLTRMRDYTVNGNLGFSGKAAIAGQVCWENRPTKYFLVPDDATLNQIIAQDGSGWGPGDRLAGRLRKCWGAEAMAFLLPSTQTYDVQDRPTRLPHCVHTQDGSTCDDVSTEPVAYRALLLDPEIAELGPTAPSSNGASAAGKWLTTGDGVNIVRWYSYYVSNAGLYPGQPCFTTIPTAYQQTSKRLVPAAVGSTYYACL